MINQASNAPALSPTTAHKSLDAARAAAGKAAADTVDPRAYSGDGDRLFWRDVNGDSGEAALC